ncbi:hypothetical protein [Reticulibacter mediterranei]|uniref:hypothetical protein n=1 Tax=Reticulibacter mediterranei TaxID=2778369 RepID=UPI001C68DC27|nr:hypothetical protein [Reticulibacter mediterranei]
MATLSLNFSAEELERQFPPRNGKRPLSLSMNRGASAIPTSIHSWLILSGKDYPASFPAGRLTSLPLFMQQCLSAETNGINDTECWGSLAIYS